MLSCPDAAGDARDGERATAAGGRPPEGGGGEGGCVWVQQTTES